MRRLCRLHESFSRMAAPAVQTQVLWSYVCARQQMGRVRPLTSLLLGGCLTLRAERGGRRVGVACSGGAPFPQGLADVGHLPGCVLLALCQVGRQLPKLAQDLRGHSQPDQAGSAEPAVSQSDWAGLQ